MELLRAEGAQVTVVPLCRTVPMPPPSPLHEAARDLGSFDWIVLTSSRAVEALAQAAGPAASLPGGANGHPGRPPYRVGFSGPGQRRPRWACVGPATAKSLERAFGFPPDLIPETASGASLAEALLAAFQRGAPATSVEGASAVTRTSASSPEQLGTVGKAPAPSGSEASASAASTASISRPLPRVLFPAAENARDELPAMLRARGIEVTQVTAYRTVPETPPPEALDPPEGRDHWDAITLTSGLAAENLVRIVRESRGETGLEWLRASHLAVLGPSAETALARFGLAPAIRADRPDLERLARAVIAALAGAK